MVAVLKGVLNKGLNDWAILLIKNSFSNFIISNARYCIIPI